MNELQGICIMQDTDTTALEIIIIEIIVIQANLKLRDGACHAAIY